MSLDATTTQMPLQKIQKTRSSDRKDWRHKTKIHEGDGKND
jgi:hypothetical protein